MLLKIAAYGRRTFHDGWNTFDAVIVAASIIEVTALSSRVFSSLRALRALRALRLLRTLRWVSR